MVNFVKGGLRDLSISRTSFQWGIPVPNDPAHVMYVWVDALCNYVSALGYGEQEKSMMDSHWPGVHVVGKDILRFHAVYWPALCMSAGIAPPKVSERAAFVASCRLRCLLPPQLSPAPPAAPQLTHVPADGVCARLVDAGGREDVKVSGERGGSVPVG